ncbi:putative reverse transcriptase domain-containing protein [Tanacetum coccineum]|uniref:Reverse transcriptase domain-containing protein n=1 Tax=Tanacetum coccineum TaxID=301880 RepID=A0ABQ5BFM4_9ASTR
MHVVILFYNGLEVPTRQILDSKGAIPSKIAADAKVAIQEMAEYSQKWHNGTSRTLSTETSDGLAAIQAQLNYLGREIKKVNEKVYPAQVGCKQCKGPHYTKDCPLKEEGASVSVMPLSTYLNLGLGELAHTKLTVELADRTVKYPKGIAENVLVGIGKFIFLIDFIILDMPEDVKVPLILERPFLSTAHAKIDVFKRKITLRVRDEKIIFKSVKPTSSLIKRVYMLSLRELMELDLEARLMGETLVLNRSLDPLYRDYIKLNNLNKPLELRRDQVDDLMPTIKEAKARNDDKMVSKIYGYPSDYDKSEKICIDCAHNLKFSCMIGFEFIHANFLPNLPINVMSKKFYNSIMKDKIEFRERNELRNWANIPIFIGNFCIVTNFVVVEDMDTYIDEGMGEVVVGKPFCEVLCVVSRRFDRVITIHDTKMGAHVFPIFYTGPRERNIDEYWKRIYKSGDLEVLES